MEATPKRSGRTSKRDLLLDAAATLVSTHGVQHLTIDAVALAANVTKAGLIYHFKTRDELLAALVERMVKDFDVQAHPPESLSPSVPTMKSALSQMSREAFDMRPEQRRLMANLLAAVSSHPQLVAPVQALYARNYAWLEDNGKEADQALLLAAAMDGVALLELLNLHQFTPRQRAALRAAMDSAIQALP